MNAPIVMPCRVTVDGTVHRLGGADQPGVFRATVGRTPDNRIVVNNPLVSRSHLAIEWRGDTWHITDMGSRNGVFLNGRRITESPVRGPLQLRLGDPTTGPVFFIAPEAGLHPGGVRSHVAAPHMQSLHQSGMEAFRVAGSQTIGRTPDNDIVVSDVLASRRHARVTATTQGMSIEDLGSVNGTFVNGHAIAHAVLGEGDVVTIGNTDLVVSHGTLVRGQTAMVATDGTPMAGADGAGVHVAGVSLVVDGGKKLLDDIEFTAAPGTLTAVIGPSGAGKSTVSKIVAGLADPTSGHVTFEGRGVHAEYEALRTRIGMVPQDDVLHRKLTLRQALGYAAELRLPPDLTGEDRERVIMGVLGELQLTEHLDTRVDKLSGGQRKRASVAMELLTGPSLLILDEPTSGLDPALDRQVMATLRRLADAGRVVLVVTHSLTYLSMCDQVLLLAPGGKTAYCGSPDNVGAQMGTTDWAEIFSFVAAQPDAAHARYRAGQPPHRQPPPAPRSGAPIRPPQTSFAGQASTIARRQWRLIMADTGYLAFLAILPVVLGLLSLVIPGSAGFSLNDVDSAGETVQILVVLVVGATFMGATLTVRDLVGERAIFERERAVGLRPSSYLWAKVLVFFIAAVIQSAVMVTITYVGRGTPEKGIVLPGTVELFISVAVLACVSALVGLAISAAVRSSEQTMPPLVIVVMVQLVFCGGLFPLTGRIGLEQLSWLFPARWGYAAAAATVDLRAVSPASPSVKDETLWDHAAANLVLSYVAMIFLGAALLAFTYSRLVLKRSR